MRRDNFMNTYEALHFASKLFSDLSEETEIKTHLVNTKQNKQQAIFFSSRDTDID